MTAAGIEAKVEIDFANEPLDVTDTWTDVSADVTGTIEIQHGLSRLTQTVTPGSAKVVFFDPDRDYDPVNTGSPHTGKMDRRNKIRISAKGTHEGGYTVIWRGYVDRWSPDYGGASGTANRTTITCSDIVSLLSSDRLPESRWFEQITAQPGKSAWYRWRERGNTTVLVDHSGNVANGVMKRQNATTTYATAFTPIAEVTVYDAFEATVPGIIPFGSSRDRAFDFTKSENRNTQTFAYNNPGGTVRPALDFAHLPTNLIGGVDWAVQMWVRCPKGHGYNATGGRTRAVIGASQPFFSVGTDNTVEYTFWWFHLAGTVSWWFCDTTPTVTTFGTGRAAGLVDGEPHLITLISVDAGGGLASLFLVYDETSYSMGNIGNHPGTTQRLQINYPSGYAGQQLGVIGDVITYDATDTPGLAECHALYVAGANPDMTGSLPKAGYRIPDALDTAGDYAGVPAALRAIDTGYDDMAPTVWDEAPIWDYCAKVAFSDGGRLFVNESGQIIFKDRTFFVDDATSSTAQFDFRDSGTLAAGDIQTTEQNWGRDLTGLLNEVRINLRDGQFGEAKDATSIDTYTRRSLTAEAFLNTESSADSLAAWVLAQHKTPTHIPETVVVTSHETNSITALLTNCKIGYRGWAHKLLPLGAGTLSAYFLVASKKWRLHDDGTYECVIGTEKLPVDTGW